jgi:RimJ/RimL family protein N-acetyltransferase
LLIVIQQMAARVGNVTKTDLATSIRTHFGVKVATVEGTPQGSPLSPLLANIMLDDLDHELERRGHKFVRYADDLRVYVRSERAAARVLEGVTAFVEERLKLRVNRAKSGVAPATVRGLLGFGFFRRDGTVRVRLDPKAKGRLKARLRQLTSRRRSIAMPVRLALLNRFLGGWAAYFALADTPSVFAEFDEWLRTEWEHPDLAFDGSSIALHDETPVALGLLHVDREHGTADNGFTATAREFRGRGLATIVKLRSLRWAAENGIERVTTSNDETNAPMLAVNRRLGYQPFGARVEYARD